MGTTVYAYVSVVDCWDGVLQRTWKLMFILLKPVVFLNAFWKTVTVNMVTWVGSHDHRGVFPEISPSFFGVVMRPERCRSLEFRQISYLDYCDGSMPSTGALNHW